MGQFAWSDIYDINMMTGLNNFLTHFLKFEKIFVFVPGLVTPLRDSEILIYHDQHYFISVR